jgi:diguanylate cyclase (GGDEF)-like protein
MESAATLRENRKNTLQQMATRNTNNLPLSGQDIQRVIGLYDSHNERCIRARYESFQRAYNEAERVPSDQDFNDILNQCRAAQDLEIGHSKQAIKEFIVSHGPASRPSAEGEYWTAFGLDRIGLDEVLNLLKIWKAKAHLRSAGTKTGEREKQMDVLLATYNKAEFLLDLPTFTSRSNEASPLSLVFMDLDKFKSINDGPGGHEAGDRALKAFAEAVVKASGGKGFAYRYGGDEFCVLLPNHCLDEALAVAERIRREVSTIRTEELLNGLSTSVGVACFPESSADPAQLVSLADAAMYKSKNAGGNRVSKADLSAR